MAISGIAIEDNLTRFVAGCAEDKYCLLELLRFLGRHPHTQFSQLAITRALNSQRQYVERALEQLTKKGLVQTQVVNNCPRYCLSESDSLVAPILDLARLDWFKWQMVLEQLVPRPEKNASIA